jgi:hypothetical protein
MSTNVAYGSSAYALPVRRSREAQPTLAPVPRRVRIVSTRAQRRSRPRMAYALGATGVIFAIFLAQLLITISLSSGAYRISDLQISQQNLGRTTSALTEQLTTLGSSQNLEANARALGMVGSSKAAFLRLSDGSVLGSASPAHSAKASTELNGSTDSVPNSLLTDIPVIQTPGTLTASTGTGHGDSNTQNPSTGTTQSTKGNNAPTQVGTSTPPSSTTPPVTNPGAIPSPVTH